MPCDVNALDFSNALENITFTGKSDIRRHAVLMNWHKYKINFASNVGDQPNFIIDIAKLLENNEEN